MPKLQYAPEGFGRYFGSALLFPSEIVFSWEELCRCAITVGRRSWADVLKFGTYSVLEALWRVAMVRANLVENSDGHLRQSNAFRALDPSEKAAVSYFLGLVLTKLIAEKVFRVPWLLHLDVYQQQVAPDFAFPDRPDFVGMDAWYLWTVFESKGRTRGVPSRVLNRAKRQVRSVRRISGQYPALRVAVGTYFGAAALRARIRDPDTPNPDGADLELNPEDLARAYYRPVVEMVQASGAALVDRAGVVALPGLDARLALDDRILRWYLDGEPRWEVVIEDRRRRGSILRDIVALRGLAEEDQASKNKEDGRHWDEIWAHQLTEIRPTGDDGVTVELGPSWGEEYMRQEPEHRAG